MPQPAACSRPDMASPRPGTQVAVPEQLSQTLQGEGGYGQPCVQEQRLSCCWGGGEKAPRAPIAAGRRREGCGETLEQPASTWRGLQDRWGKDFQQGLLR